MANARSASLYTKLYSPKNGRNGDLGSEPLWSPGAKLLVSESGGGGKAP